MCKDPNLNQGNIFLWLKHTIQERKRSPPLFGELRWSCEKLRNSQLPTNRKHLMTARSFSSAVPVTKESALLYFLPAHMLNFDFKDLDCFSGVRNFLIGKLLAGIVFHGKPL